MSNIKRNVNGTVIELELIYVNPDDLLLDDDNTRIYFPLQQLPKGERSEAAMELLLYTQEDVPRLKRSIFETRGVQEPIYITCDNIVKEGNRRVAALRELKKENPGEAGFEAMPAWVIPEGTPEEVIRELVNSAHLDPKRPWPPFERAIELKSLNEEGTPVTILAAKYGMDEAEVRENITAAGLMLTEFVPMFEDQAGIEVKSKFSYFVEYVKGPRKEHVQNISNLDSKFASWVKNGQIPKAEKVRRLGKVLGNENAIIVLEDQGFDAAMEIVMDEDINENPFYKTIDKAIKSINRLGPSELLELKSNVEKQNAVIELAKSVNDVIQLIGIPV